MKKLILLASLMTFSILSIVPALAQEVDPQPNATTDQYGPGPADAEAAAENAVKDIISRGADDDGAAAYEAALNAAREAGTDENTAVVVAAEAVADVSEEPEAPEEPEMTELPVTGGSSVFALGAGLLLVGGGVLARRLF
ncbi:hypothetical protein BH24ACT21_BH24ACT21_11110 [soil metagenome]